MEPSATMEGAQLVGSLSDLTARGFLRIGGRSNSICVFLDGATPRAVDGRCPHMGVFLHFGTVVEGQIVCAFHGGCFDLSTGKCRDGVYDDIRVYPTVVIDGNVYVVVEPVKDAS